MSLRLAYTAAFPIILFWSYRHLEDLNQRRVVVAGLAVSLLPLLPLLLSVANWDWLRQPSGAEPSGCAYDPVADTWSATSIVAAP